MRLVKRCWPFAVLAAQNLIIFCGHYFAGVGFPWDFPKTYYATVAFWTSAVSRGVFPQWIPFQSMGYPAAINLQLGMYYPPFWLFPLLGMPYTLTAAVAVQCLHVLLGSIGMYCFLRCWGNPAKYAIVGAIAFQFFGGFYSNSEHADIVRAFALAPWLLYALKMREGREGLLRQAVLVPLLVYMLATGGYPGNLISSLFIVSLYVVLQLVDRRAKGRSLVKESGYSAFALGLVALGLALALVDLGPAWAERRELTRMSQATSIGAVGLWIQHLPGLFLSNRRLPGEVSMTSTYVTLPALIFAGFVSTKRLKQHWILAAIGVVSLLMVPAAKSPFWVALTTLVPPLRLSRFPTSDYRVFIAIPVIAFSVIGLRVVMERELTRRSLILRTAPVLVWLPMGLWAGKVSVWDFSAVAPIPVAGAIIALVVYMWRRRTGFVGAAITLVAILTVLDGLWVLYDMNSWRAPDMIARYDSQLPVMRDGTLASFASFEELPASRPPRKQVANKQDFSWRGYLDGSYMMSDWGNTVLLARQAVESDPLYQQYMLMRWTPLFFGTDLAADGTTQISLPDSGLADALSEQARGNSVGSVEQTHYGLNDITYRVSLQKPSVMVENEIYFPGWHASLVSAGCTTSVQALAVNDVFRAWVLPAGNYDMIASFEFPNMRIYRTASLLALIGWLSVIGLARLRYCRDARRPLGPLPDHARLARSPSEPPSPRRL